MIVGRLAPSPTGLLHLGNVRSLALAYLAARAVGGRLYLRIEDLLPGLDAHIAPLLQDLEWLGLDCDPAPADPFATELRPWWKQSERAPLFATIVQDLLAAGAAYPCVCTRKDIERAALAPHAEDLAAAYPGTCRDRFASLTEAQLFETGRARHEQRPDLGVAVRLRVPPGELSFDDLCHAHQVSDVAGQAGDIVIQRKDGGFAYMLAVVVDDLAMGVDQVVRGDDLREVTGQQVAVLSALAALAPIHRGASPADAVYLAAQRRQPPQYAHVPLVLGDDGRRLAKRNQSLHLRQLRTAGVAAAAIRSWVLQSIGVNGALDWVAAAAAFDWTRLPPDPVVFGAADLAALTA